MTTTTTMAAGVPPAPAAPAPAPPAPFAAPAPMPAPRAFGVVEAPTVFPSEADFRDPHAYIQSLRPLGDQFGLVKVVPPPSWDPPFCLEPASFAFECRRQRVGSLGVVTRGRRDWLRRLGNFHRLRGGAEPRPVAAGAPLDLYALRQVVVSAGGAAAVGAQGRWPAVVWTLFGAAEPALVQQVATAYLGAVEPFEAYVGAVLGAIGAEDADSSSDGETETETDGESEAEAAPQPGRGRGRPPRPAASPVKKERSRSSPGAPRKCADCRRPESELGAAARFLLPAAAAAETWHCPRCLARPRTFLFDNGDEYTLDEFETMAAAFKREYLAKAGVTLTGRALETWLEAEFWRHVNDPHCALEVEYGAEIRCDEEGSGFPMRKHDRGGEWAAYLDHPWNLNNLPHIRESLFQYMRAPISGVTVPWAYVGMLFSAFCWHTEDHWCYSLNYQHRGDPKTWYGIPSRAAAAFEQVSRQLVPESFAKNPDLLAQRSSLVAPALLARAGVPVCATEQRPGQFIVTFPNAYHAGFNQGFNVNEAVNYVPPDWLELGAAALDNYRRTRHEPTFSHEELLVRAAADTANTAVRPAVLRALRAAAAKERRLRTAVRRAPRLARVATYAVSRRKLEQSLDAPGYRCAACRTLPYFSRFAVRAPGADPTFYCLECMLGPAGARVARPSLELCFSARELRELVKAGANGDGADDSAGDGADDSDSE